MGLSPWSLTKAVQGHLTALKGFDKVLSHGTGKALLQPIGSPKGLNLDRAIPPGQTGHTWPTKGQCNA